MANNPWPMFMDAMGERESSGDYQCVNAFGYLGKFQFGSLRLQDLGLVDCHGKWKNGLSQKKFLDSPAIQDACFIYHVARLSKVIRERHGHYFDTMQVFGHPVTLSGCVAVAHLLGLGGLGDLLHGQLDRKDGFGTSASDYLGHFAGFEIPENLPVNLNIGG